MLAMIDERLRTTTLPLSALCCCDYQFAMHRFHRTIIEEFYEITFRKKLYSDLDTLQADLDAWVEDYNLERSHQGKMCADGHHCRRCLMDASCGIRRLVN